MVLEAQKISSGDPQEENWAIGTKLPNMQLPTKLKGKWVNLRSFARGKRGESIDWRGVE